MTYPDHRDPKEPEEGAFPLHDAVAAKREELSKQVIEEMEKYPPYLPVMLPNDSDLTLVPSVFPAYGADSGPVHNGTRSIPDLQKRIHAWAVRKEWRGPKATPRGIGDDIALITSELSEALEAYRECGDPTKEWSSYEIVVGDVKLKNLSEEQVVALTRQTPGELDLIPKPEGLPSELADAAIRLIETCEEHGIDLEAKIIEKMKYNETRSIRHGNKKM